MYYRRFNSSSGIRSESGLGREVSELRILNAEWVRQYLLHRAYCA
jgi:hypothetical protein